MTESGPRFRQPGDVVAHGNDAYVVLSPQPDQRTSLDGFVPAVKLRGDGYLHWIPSREAA